MNVNKPCKQIIVNLSRGVNVLSSVCYMTLSRVNVLSGFGSDNKLLCYAGISHFKSFFSVCLEFVYKSLVSIGGKSVEIIICSGQIFPVKGY